MKKRFLILFLVVTLIASFCASVALAQDEAAVNDSALSTQEEIVNGDSSQNEPQAGESEPAEAIAESVSEVQSGSTAESVSEVQTESTAEPESDIQPESTAEPESEIQPESTAEPESEIQPESTAEPESEVQPESTAEPVSEIQPESTEEAEDTPYSVEIGDYVLEGGTSVPLADILKELGYEGTIEAASFSNENLCAVENVDGVWMFQSKNAFSSEQTLTVTLDGVAYDIEVLDYNVKLIRNDDTEEEYDKLQDAINDTVDGTDVRLQLIENIDGETINIGDRNVTVDLYGHSWSDSIKKIGNGILSFINTATQAVEGFVHSVVAKITGEECDTYYNTSLAGALDLAGNATTEITMVQDVTIRGNSGVTIAKDQNITLDLNGYTVQNAVNENKGSQVITNNGTLTIKDSTDQEKNGNGDGLLKNAIEEGTQPGEWWSEPQYNYASNVITNFGTLTVESGKIEQTANSSICYAVDNNSNVRDAILTVNGGLLKNEATAVIRQFAQPAGKNEVTINGGTVDGYTGDWIQLPGGTDPRTALLTINGGTINASYYAFYDYSYGNPFDKVKYEINGGNINGPIFSYGANMTINDGVFSDDIFVYKNKKGFDNTVLVNGGRFSGDVSVYDYRGGTTAYYGKAINGGVFKPYDYIYDGDIYYYDWVHEINYPPYVDMYNYDPETMEEYPYTVGEPVTVIFQDEQGNPLLENRYVKKGTTLYNEFFTEFFEKELPTKPGYHFVRWDPAFAPLEDDQIYTPIFEKDPVTPSEEETTPVVPMSSLAVTPAVNPDTEKETRITVPVKDKETVRVEATVSDTKATVSDISKEIIDQLLSNENATKEVEIDCSDLPDMTIQKVEFKTDNLDMIARSEVESLKVSMDTGSVIMDKTAVNAIATLSNGPTVTLVIDDIEDTSLNAAQKETVKAVDNLVVVIDSYILSDTQKIRDLGEGKVALAFSQKILNNYMPDMLHVYELKPDGSKVEIMFRIVNGEIVFDVNYLSTYIIVHD